MSMDVAERYEIITKALSHYKNKLNIIIDSKENKHLKDIFDESLSKKLQLLDEMIATYTKNDTKSLRAQWDRYHYAVCATLKVYRSDLEESSKILEQKMKDYAPNNDFITEKIRKVDVIINSTCIDYFRELEAGLRRKTF